MAPPVTPTREQIETMEAGPEMDALVAEAIGMEKIALKGGVPGATNVYYVAANQYLDGSPPKFSTDIAAAWKVVEKVRAARWCVRVEANDYAPDAKWHALFYREHDGERQQHRFGFAATVPHAISRAALLSTL